MPVIYRKTKGAPLTIDEMDENFAHLEKRISELENTPVMAEGIADIRQDQDQLTIVGTMGHTWGPFHLPKFLMRPRGEWQSRISYVYGDLVAYLGSSYMCVLPHASEDFENKNWQLLMGKI